MPRKATGSAYESDGHWYASLTLGPKLRRSIRLPSCHDELAAKARLVILADLAVELRKASVATGLAVDLLTKIAPLEGKALAGALKLAAEVAREWFAPGRELVEFISTIGES